MSTEMVVSAGNHDRRHCPVTVHLHDRLASAGVTDARGREIPCQVAPCADGTDLTFIVERLDAGQTLACTLEPGAPSAAAPKAELLRRENQIDVKLSGRHVTTYVFGGRGLVRPYLFPVMAPCGVGVTRSFPMVEGVPGETSDHRHHRSVWIAHGDVNGVDNWSEEKSHGFTVHREFADLAGGPAYARITARNDWTSREGKKVLDEESSFTFYNVLEGGHLCDVVIRFRATEGRVVFGDTKEGGILSVRTASSIDVTRGGTIVNSFGGINERETWGKKAHWCDYSGPVGGKTAGIAIFDHPGNLRHPTNWHVRDYGLMTANCFGWSHFTGNPAMRGDYVLEAGGELVFRYRLYVHDGTTSDADVAGKYHDYVNPPTVTLKT